MLVALALVIKGIVQLCVVHNAGFDLRLVWTAVHYYLRGANPFEASFYHNDVARGLTPTNAPAYFPELGWPEQVNYPPSSTLTQILTYGVPWSLARGYYVALSLLGCWAVAWWASSGRRNKTEIAFIAGVALANLGYAQTIINGNQGIFVMGALACAIISRSERPILAGLCLGIALVKPTISAPFVLLFAADRRYRTLVTCAVYLLASTLLTVVLAHTALTTLMAQTLEGSVRYATGGYALWKVFRSAGLGMGFSLALNAGIFYVPLGLLLWRTRDAGKSFTAGMLALVAVIARISTYHNSIDNVVMSFLTVALGVRFLESRRAEDGTWLAVVVVSLLIPFVATDTVARHTALYVLWAAAAVREVSLTLT